MYKKLLNVIVKLTEKVAMLADNQMRIYEKGVRAGNEALHAVLTIEQNLSEEEKKQARKNTGAVATVNGISPDENGNVQVETGDGAIILKKEAFTGLQTLVEWVHSNFARIQQVKISAPGLFDSFNVEVGYCAEVSAYQFTALEYMPGLGSGRYHDGVKKTVLLLDPAKKLARIALTKMEYVAEDTSPAGFYHSGPEEAFFDEEDWSAMGIEVVIYYYSERSDTTIS